VIAQAWADLVTVSNFIVHTPVILVGGLMLAASVITTLLINEVRNK
jgi:hypothetical protein